MTLLRTIKVVEKEHFFFRFGPCSPPAYPLAELFLTIAQPKLRTIHPKIWYPRKKVKTPRMNADPIRSDRADRPAEQLCARAAAFSVPVISKNFSLTQNPRFDIRQ